VIRHERHGIEGSYQESLTRRAVPLSGLPMLRGAQGHNWRAALTQGHSKCHSFRVFSGAEHLGMHIVKTPKQCMSGCLLSVADSWVPVPSRTPEGCTKH
jgi:hypothetical protein